MNTEVMYTWKEKDYEDKDTVKDIVNVLVVEYLLLLLKNIQTHQGNQGGEKKIIL